MNNLSNDTPYSETIGSFIRNGNYPLEANYIFPSEEALKEFYSDEVNATTIHKGLLKIVSSENSQTLYWVVEVEGELQFKPLIQEESIDKLFDRLAQIRNDLNQEISDRKKESNNLQTELDQTQVGVGLSSDGSFNPDQETNYLKSSTSVMNALKTLDGLIAETSSPSKLLPVETDTVSIAIDKDTVDSNISANVKVANGSDIIVNNDGLYTKLSTEYTDGILTIKVNGKVRSQHTLAISSIIDNAYYDQNTKSLIITFGNSQEVSIPIDELIEEWTVDNPDDKVVELYREKVTSGTDKLSADVRLDSSEYNILKKVENSLGVDGRSSSITHDGQPLDKVLKDITETTNTLSEWYEG